MFFTVLNGEYTRKLLRAAGWRRINIAQLAGSSDGEAVAPAAHSATGQQCASRHVAR